jgi:hypothetical protein
MVQPLIEANADSILKRNGLSRLWPMLVYPNLHVLTKVYSQFIKRRLQANMELVLFLSTYQC